MDATEVCAVGMLGWCIRSNDRECEGQWGLFNSIVAALFEWQAPRFFRVHPGRRCQEVGVKGGRFIMEVVGFVAPGYEPVKALFRQHFIDGLEDRAQLCVYVRGEKVIDIWGSAVGKPYGPGFLQNVFSTTKVLTSLVVAMLVDRGQLSYDTPIDEIWPEYGQHKKQGTTVAQLMRHEAGLPKFDQPIAAEALKTENIRKGSISDLIASQSLSHFPLKRREYHAQTRGWIANEIVRRVDVPRHRTIGQFLREEVSEKLDIAEELFIGTPAAFHGNIAPIDTKLQNALWWSWYQLLAPNILGGGKLPLLYDRYRMTLLAGIPLFQLGLMPTVRRVMRLTLSSKRSDASSGKGAPPPAKKHFEILFSGNSSATKSEGFSFDSVAHMFNSPEVRLAEAPSSNGHASARALAKVAASIVERGQLKNHPRLLSAAGVDKAHDGIVHKTVFGVLPTDFGNAGWNYFQTSGPLGHGGFTGWMGYGGSVMQWHREERIAVGYAMNMLEVTLTNERSTALQAEILHCVARRKSKM